MGVGLAWTLLGCAHGRSAHDNPQDSTASASSAEAEANADTCPARGVYLQVLGSGGPIADDGRASSAYLVWVDGEARVLIDAGSGLFERYARSGARFEDLDVVALSHLHVDHSAGLMGLLKTGYFSRRERPLTIVGPAGSASFPSTPEFVHALVGDGGIYGYLGYEGEKPPFPLDVHVASVDGDAAYEGEAARVLARTVVHGNAPSLGFVVEAGGKKLAFAGDQSARGRQAFRDLAKDADLIVAHHAVPEGADAALLTLHATPSSIGELANGVGAKQLVLSHHMKRALAAWHQGEAALRKHYAGPVSVASDLQCIAP